MVDAQTPAPADTETEDRRPILLFLLAVMPDPGLHHERRRAKIQDAV